MNYKELGGDDPSVSVGGNETSLTPDEIKKYVRSLHETEAINLESDRIDTLLFGLPSTDLERKIVGVDEFSTPIISFAERYPSERPWNGIYSIIWTPYKDIKTIVQELDLSEENTFYDLGSGYGRIPLYAGITTEATCKGIELVPERAEIAREASKKLQLKKVDFITANVLDVDFSDGDTFYIYNAFSDDTFPQVFGRLQDIVKQREASGKGPVTLIAQGNLPSFDNLQGFQLKKMLLPKPAKYGTPHIGVYRSTPQIGKTRI